MSLSKQDKEDIMKAIIIAGILSHECMSSKGVVDRANKIMEEINKYENNESREVGCS